MEPGGSNLGTNVREIKGDNAGEMTLATINTHYLKGPITVTGPVTSFGP